MTRTTHHLIIVLLWSILMTIVSCNGTNDTQIAKEEISETPPSVSGDTAGKLVIRLSEKEKQELKIETEKVTSNIQNYTLSAPGMVFPAPGHVSIISTPIDGRISDIMVREGQLIQRGQEIFKIESLVFGNLVAEYLQALAEEKFQTTRLDRLKQLVAQTISSRSELDKATSDYQRALTASIASHAKLKAIGVPDHEIEALQNTNTIDPVLKIHAPISGSFDQRSVDLGQSVNALEKIGRIIDLKKVLIKGYLNPEDATLVNPGDSVTIGQRENVDKG